MTFPPIRYALFDLDGTLLDSMGIWEDFGANYLRTYGIQAPPSLNTVLRPMSLEQAADYLHEAYLPSVPVSRIQQEVNRMTEDLYTRSVAAKPSAEAFLRKLKERGVPMGVATATDYRSVELALQRLGLFELFDFILTCTQVGSGKDRPDIFHLAAEKFGAPAQEVVVFEDSLYAAKTAKAAGFPVVAVADPYSRHHAEQLKILCDCYLDSFAQWVWEEPQPHLQPEGCFPDQDR